MDRDKMELLIRTVLPSVCMVLLLSSESNCGPNCTDIRLYSTKHRYGEGRVEILCNGEWGTISSNDTTIDSVICRHLGFGQEWRPSRTAEFGQGYGPVWDVQCEGRELKIQDCSINPTDPDDSYFYLSENLTLLSFNHDNDIGVKCQGLKIRDLSQNDELHEDGNRRKESDDSMNKEQTKVHGDSFAMIVVDVVGFALVLAVIALCGFLINRRFAVNSCASKEKDQSQTLLSPSSHVTIQAEPISHDQAEGGLELTDEKDNHGPALTEVNPVYEPAIEMAETSLVGERQEFKELTDSSDPVLTEYNPCYGAAVGMTETSPTAPPEENPYYEKC